MFLDNNGSAVNYSWKSKLVTVYYCRCFTLFEYLPHFQWDGNDWEIGGGNEGGSSLLIKKKITSYLMFLVVEKMPGYYDFLVIQRFTPIFRFMLFCSRVYICAKAVVSFWGQILLMSRNTKYILIVATSVAYLRRTCFCWI